MNELSRKPPDLDLAERPTRPTALSPSSAEGRRQGAGDTPPPPRFNLPDSYWSEPRMNPSDASHLDGFDSTKLVARLLAASSRSEATVAAMLERLDADRENDPRSRTESCGLQVNIVRFQPAAFELSAETLARARLIVLNDPEGKALESRPEAPAATGSAATITQQDAASGCCIPPSCTIL